MDNINLPPGVFKNFKLKVELLEVHEGTPPRPATASASGPAGGQLPESRAFDEGTVTATATSHALRAAAGLPVTSGPARARACAGVVSGPAARAGLGAGA